MVDIMLQIMRGTMKDKRFRHPRYVIHSVEFLTERLFGKAVIQAVADSGSTISITVMGPQLPEASSVSNSTAIEASDTVSLQLSVSEPQASFFSEKE